MDVHQPEASSSTSSPPVIHQATLVFDSGLSRERFTELIETNGIVHKLVLRLMEKYGGEPCLRIGLVITAQDAAYPDPRTLHSVIPAYRQDFRRPSALLTSLPSLASRFSPQAVLTRPKSSLMSDMWDMEDGGFSISSSEPGPSDYFLGGLVAAVELLDHHTLPSSVVPPGALQSLSPPSALPMMSMVYKNPSAESRNSHLVVFTEKASLATIDSDSRGSQASWTRDDSCAAYDDVDWNTIGDKCKEKDIAASCVIVGSSQPRRGSAAPPIGRDGAASAEKLRKMCLASAVEDGPDDPWFTLPADSEVFLAGFTIKAIPPPVVNEPAAASKGATAAPTENLTEAQIKYQLAQKQAMAMKMNNGGQAAPGQGNFNVLASLLQSGRLDPNVMAQLVANVRSDDPASRQKAMQQLSSLMSLQKQQSINSVSQATGALSNAGGATGLNAAQQQQFLAAMQARALQANQANQTQVATSGTSNEQNQNAQQNAQQLQQQQQLLMQQRQAQLAAQNQNNANNGTAAPTPGQPRPTPQTVWSGSISWTMKGADNQPQKWVIPVDCMLLSTQTDSSQLQTNIWPQNLEMTGMSGMNMTELQTYVKANQAPCVLFSVSAQADSSSRSKMSYLTMTLGSKSLCAFIKFGGPGCGILLISSNQPSNSADKTYRLLGVVCLKVPFNFPANSGATSAAPQTTAPAHVSQQVQQPAVAPQVNPAIRPAPVTINGATNQFQGAIQNNNFLQQAQLQSQFLQQQQQQQQQPQQGTPQTHARTPSQNIGTPHSQGFQTPQQNQQARLPAQSNQMTPSTLQQFANQPNVQTIQQLQLRQLQAQAQLQQAGMQQQAHQAAQQAQPAQQPAQPTQGQSAPIAFTPQQRLGIVKLLRDAGMNVPDNFDPNLIPRDALVQFMQNANARHKQAQAQAAAAAAAAGGVNKPAAPPVNPVNLGNFAANGTGVNGQPNFAQMGQQAQQMQQNAMTGLQLGQFAGLQQFQQAQAQAAAAGGAGAANSSALGLFAAQQGLNVGQFQQSVGLGQFQQH